MKKNARVLEKLVSPGLPGLQVATCLATINSINFGGLNMTDFETLIKSLSLAWIGRYLNENSAPWKSIFQYQLKNYGGTIFLKCNYNIKDYEINSQFYRELLMWWTDFREKHPRIKWKKYFVE